MRAVVSVIVPTRNRPAALRNCLAALSSQEWPASCLEVVVVNDGGEPLGEELRQDGWLVVDRPQGGPAAARNTGAARARGDILAFTDDDCIPDPLWVASMVGRLDADPDSVVGGQVLNGLPHNRYARASQLLIGFLYRYYHEEGRGHLPFFTTNNLAMRAATFERVGPFDETFPFASEDRDWSDRCLHGGGRLVYAPEAIVRHAHPLTMTTFARQHFGYGEGAWRFRRSRSQRRGERTRLEAMGFYAGMLRAPFEAGDPEAVRVSLLLAMSQAVAAAGLVYAGLTGTNQAADATSAS